MAFDPTQLTGKLLCFIADAANITLVAVTGVSVWKDLSGNSRDATTGTIPPTFNSAGLNGQGTITFANLLQTSLSFTGTNIFSSSRKTGIYVVLANNAHNGENIFFSAALNAGATEFPILIHIKSIGYTFSSQSVTFAHPPVWLTANNTDWHTLSFSCDFATPTNSSLYLDSVLQTQDVGTTQDWGNTDTIGNYDANGSGTYCFSGDIAALIAVDHEFSGTERANLDAWAHTKYGLGAEVFHLPAQVGKRGPTIWTRHMKARRNRIVAGAVGGAVAMAAVAHFALHWF